MLARDHQALKDRLQALGILGIARAAKRRFGPAGLAQLGAVVAAYLYNKWLSNFPSNTVRTFYLRRVLGYRLGRRVFVHMGCFFEGPNISIGQNSVVGRHCYLGGSGGTLTIGRNVSITARAYVFCASHLPDSPTFESVYGDVTIGDRAWLGVAAIVMPGVTIGEGAVIGAAAVVTKDVPEFTVWAGVPAKKIGERETNLTYELDYWPWFN